MTRQGQSLYAHYNRDYFGPAGQRVRGFTDVRTPRRDGMGQKLKSHHYFYKQSSGFYEQLVC